MSEVPPNEPNPQSNTGQSEGPSRAPFPGKRLLFAIAFGFVAYFIFWLIIILAVAQFIIVAVLGKPKDDLRNVSLRLVEYLWQMLSYISFGKDDEPYPIGEFPGPRE